MVIGSDVSKISITTDSVNGGDGSLLTITINWYNHQYSCTLNPSSTDTTYSCTSFTPTAILPNSYIPYFIKLEYVSAPPLQISMINVTDNRGFFYAIDRFCIRLV